jgi:hypothetical protein
MNVGQVKIVIATHRSQDTMLSRSPDGNVPPSGRYGAQFFAGKICQDFSQSDGRVVRLIGHSSPPVGEVLTDTPVIRTGAGNAERVG